MEQMAVLAAEAVVLLLVVLVVLVTPQRNLRAKVAMAALEQAVLTKVVEAAALPLLVLQQQQYLGLAVLEPHLLLPDHLLPEQAAVEVVEILLVRVVQVAAVMEVLEV
jgi:hypothetical protein